MQGRSQSSLKNVIVLVLHSQYLIYQIHFPEKQRRKGQET